MKQASISTHVLDLISGLPAEGLTVSLLNADGTAIASGVTDVDGRISQWTPDFDLTEGDYRLVFATKEWFASRQLETFYPLVSIDFTIEEVRHHHVPLLLSSYGYSTYRGS